MRIKLIDTTLKQLTLAQKKQLKRFELELNWLFLRRYFTAGCKKKGLKKKEKGEGAKKMKIKYKNYGSAEWEIPVL